jgi:hypothetical protein
MKYYGVIGKRNVHDESDEFNEVVKKFDKLKYLGNIGKRSAAAAAAALSKKKSTEKKLDKMKYFGIYNFIFIMFNYTIIIIINRYAW